MGLEEIWNSCGHREWGKLQVKCIDAKEIGIIGIACCLIVIFEIKVHRVSTGWKNGFPGEGMNRKGHKYGVLLPSFMQREGRGCCGFKTEKVANRRNSALGEILRESSRHHGGTLRYQRRQREPSWERAILEGPCNPGGYPECEAVFMIIP